MNWLYDHLRFVKDHGPVVLTENLVNRGEFPLLEARCFDDKTFRRRVWHKFTGTRLYPSKKRWLQRVKPQLLHSHFGYVAVEDFQLQKFLQVPWFVSFYGADVYQLGRHDIWRRKYEPLFEQAAKLLVLGPVMATALEKLGCPKEKILVHPLGVDVDAIPGKARILREGEALKVLFAGTFREKKGARYVVEGASLARKAGVNLHLYIAGDAGEKPGDQEAKQEIGRLIRSCGLEESVTHCSFVPFQKLIELALSSHVFVVPSVTAADGDAEGTPFVLQQMMATGMPCIATNHSDIPFLFGEHHHLLVPERDSRAIAERLECYAGNPDRLLEDGLKLHDRIHSTFNVRACAARLSEIYDAIAFS
jgi:colanic acid/amylovoran biosynthesis glycosyltransferase